MKSLLFLLACLLVLSPACRRARPPAAVSELVLARDSHSDRILRGIYPGNEGWRWTAPVFAFSLDPPAAAPVYLELDFTVPDELTPETAAVTVVAKVNGVEAARQTYQKAGRYTLDSRLAAQALTRRPA